MTLLRLITVLCALGLLWGTPAFAQGIGPVGPNVYPEEEEEAAPEEPVSKTKTPAETQKKATSPANATRTATGTIKRSPAATGSTMNTDAFGTTTYQRSYDPQTGRSIWTENDIQRMCHRRWADKPNRYQNCLAVNRQRVGQEKTPSSLREINNSGFNSNSLNNNYYR